MYSCSECSDLLLDFLYGLLESEEVQRLRAHLADCPACRAALADAEAQQRLLARAARVARAVPAFVAPSESASGDAPASPASETTTSTPSTADPVTLPITRGHRRVLWRWAWLATAAAILLLAGRVYWSYEDGLHRHQAELAQAQHAVEAVDARFASASRAYEEELTRLPGQIRDRQLRLEVAGPATYQADAPAQVRISTRDAKGRPRAAELEVTVVDATGKKTLLEQNIKNPGETSLVLPPALPVQPGTAVQLVVKAATDGDAVQLRELLSTAAPSYDTHVVLNKPVYRPGEMLSFRTLTLDRFSLKPPGREVPLKFALRDGRNVIRQLPGKTRPDGVAGGEFVLAGLAAGTDYSLEVASDGPAQEGRVLPRSTRFTILRDDNALFANLKDGTTNTRIQQEIPVAPAYPEVEFFPEGGDLTASVPNSVYFRALTPQGVPTDVQGRVVDRAGKEVAVVKSGQGGTPALRGLGSFNLTPQAGQSYTFQMDVAAQTKKVAPLPPVHRAGIALSVLDSVGQEGEPITVVVRSSEPVSQLLALATCRGHIVDQQFFSGAAKDTTVRLRPVAGTRGIVRLTIYEVRQDELLPRAERLVYRIPAERLIVSSADSGKKAYRAGDHIEVGVQVKDEKGVPAAATLLAAAVNERVLLPGQPEQGPPAFFYLTSDVQEGADLENADFLVSDAPQARAALDLFLGTQGWRRFNIPDTVAGLGQSLASAAPIPDRPAVFNRDNSAEVATRSAQLQAAGQVELRRKAVQQRGTIQEERERCVQAARAAAAALADYEQMPQRGLRFGVGVLVLVLLAAGGVLLIVGCVRIVLGRRPTAAFATAFTSLLLCLVLYGATTAWREHGSGRDDARWAVADKRLPQPLLEAPMPRGDAQEAEAVKHPTPPLGRFREAPQQQAATALSAANTAARARDRILADENRRAAQEQLSKGSLTRDQATQGRSGGAATQEQLSKGSVAQSMKKAMGSPATGGGYGGNSPPAAGPLPPPGPAGAAPATRGARTAQEKAQSDPAANQNLQLPGAAPAPASQAQLNEAQALRTYAYRNAATPGVMAPDTLLWYPALVATDGSARIGFDAPNEPATYRLLLYASSPSGRLGAYRGQIITRK